MSKVQFNKEAIAASQNATVTGIYGAQSQAGNGKVLKAIKKIGGKVLDVVGDGVKYAKKSHIVSTGLKVGAAGAILTGDPLLAAKLGAAGTIASQTGFSQKPMVVGKAIQKQSQRQTQAVLKIGNAIKARKA